MSASRKSLGGITQSRFNLSHQNPATPSVFPPIRSRTGTQLRSSRSVRHINANTVQPSSARGILRRLAKITAPTTKRRVLTPTTVLDNKENIVPRSDDDDDDDDSKRPKINFDIEESIDDDGSELLVAPTPSALLDESDEDEEQPTITFPLLGQEHTNKRRFSGVHLLPHSDSALQDDPDDIDDGNSTFLTEHGRRAISEEPTRVSRYSFGSIRMSDFGSELEIRRQSDRQQKLAALEADDNYGGGLDTDNNIGFDGETENLRDLRIPSPQPSISVGEESIDAHGDNNDTFQLDMPDSPTSDVANATERGNIVEQPQLVDNVLLGEHADGALGPIETQSDSLNGQHGLVESIAAAAVTRPRRRLKMNHRGNMIPSIPSSLIKRIVHESQAKANKRKTTLGKDHMKALEQATEWFFEQVSEDLETYSQHSRRKKRIDADDVLLLMRRQRVLRNDGDLQKLAKDWLPREVLNDLDLPDRP